MTSILDINSDASDSEDDNYVPNKDGDTSDSVSEEEEEDEGYLQTGDNGHSNGKTRSKKSKNSFKNADEEEEKPPENEEERKKREAELFKKFMDDVKQESSATNSVESARKLESVPAKVTVTEEYEFAGESVKVTKEVPVTAPSPSEARAVPNPLKRSGGLSSLVGALDKKKQKLSTLEKSRLDWNSFKQQEGIDEELQQHNRGKGGYLERQAFLQRSDYKQFEIERSLRLKRK